jgi:AcrR family transcriptional regulator
MIDGLATDRRQDLTLAAYRRIAAVGLEGLRTRDVALEVGVNVATLHYYFPSKESLIQAVVVHAMGRFGSTLSSAESPAEQLRDHLAALRRLLHEEPELFTVLCELAMRVPRDPQIAAMLRQTDDPWHAYVGGLLQGSEASGPNGDAEDAAAVVLAAIKGLSMPNADARRSERIDQTFRQLHRWLGLTDEESNP